MEPAVLSETPDGSTMEEQRQEVPPEERHDITPDQWEAIKDLLPGRDGTPGRTAKCNLLFINALMWICKTGAAWRDVPSRFGKWNTAFRRFNRWCKRGVLQRVFEKLQDPDIQQLFVDSTVIRAHQHASGAAHTTPEAEALGRSRGGFSTKIHIACSDLRKPVKFILTGGQTHDVTQGPELIAGSPADHVIADKAYDSDDFVVRIHEQNAEAVIPPRSNRTEARDYDKEKYKQRNVVERLINFLKQCRRVATRYEKTGRNYLGMVQFAAIFVMLH